MSKSTNITNFIFEHPETSGTRNFFSLLELKILKYMFALSHLGFSFIAAGGPFGKSSLPYWHK